MTTANGLSAAEYWEKRYSENGKSWSGNVNVALEREISGTAPGTALDLGSGEGGDALWLARNGWAVTAVDIAPSAHAIGAAAQRPGDNISWVAADLATWVAPTRYDLVTSCFLHSTVDLPREQILRRAAEAVTPGGTLLIVGHFGHPHWLGAADDGHGDNTHAHDTHDSGEHRHDVDELPTPEALMSTLFADNPALDLSEWQIVTSGLIDRPITAPDGTETTIVDSVLNIRRAA